MNSKERWYIYTVEYYAAIEKKKFVSSLVKWMGFPGSDGRESICNGGDLGWIPESGKSPGGGHGNPLQDSCLENRHGERSLMGTVHEVAKSRM